MIQPVQVTALPGPAYEVEWEEGNQRHRFTCEVDDRRQILGVDTSQAIVDLVLAVHRARHDAVPIPGRVLVHLARITALPDGAYELVFEAGETSLRFVCEARQHKGISYVTSEPSLTQNDPAYDGPDIGDPRPVASVVLAMHQARHQQPFDREHESQ